MIAGGGLDSTEIGLLACIFSFLAVLATVRINWPILKLMWRDLRAAIRKPPHDASSDFICGDRPQIPSINRPRGD